MHNLLFNKRVTAGAEFSCVTFDLHIDVDGVAWGWLTELDFPRPQ